MCVFFIPLFFGFDFFGFFRSWSECVYTKFVYIWIHCGKCHFLRVAKCDFRFVHDTLHRTHLNQTKLHLCRTFFPDSLRFLAICVSCISIGMNKSVFSQHLPSYMPFDTFSCSILFVTPLPHAPTCTNDQNCGSIQRVYCRNGNKYWVFFKYKTSITYTYTYAYVLLIHRHWFDGTSASVVWRIKKKLYALSSLYWMWEYFVLFLPHMEIVKRIRKHVIWFADFKWWLFPIRIHMYITFFRSSLISRLLIKFNFLKWKRIYTSTCTNPSNV